MRYASREALGGSAVVVRVDPPLAVMSAHVVLFGAKSESLTGLEFLDAQTKDIQARAVGIMGEPGTPFSGLDYSTDFTLVRLDLVPDGLSMVELSAEAPEIGELVDIVACPPDGASRQVVIEGSIASADAGKIEVAIAPRTETRAMAGSPVFSKRTGRVVAFLQNVVSKDGRGAVLATPARYVRAAVERVKPGDHALPLVEWTAK